MGYLILLVQHRKVSQLRLKLPHSLIYLLKPHHSWAVPEEQNSLRLWTA